MEGTFAFANGAWGFTLADQNVAAADFVSNLSKLMHSKDGLAGAKLTETHAGSFAGSTISVTVAP